MMDTVHERAKRDREKFVLAVISSAAPKKVVVAGPGTGKTYLFKRILSGKRKALAVTFVNALVDELSLELCGLAEVRTLHSFALECLNRAKQRVKVFSRLSDIIREDGALILGRDVDFDAAFSTLAVQQSDLEFYKKRKDFYGHYGFTDIVYAAYKLFEANERMIPAYDQIVVDEYQDFSRLEVSLIDYLARRSPVLLVGDDDQALYAFKAATPDHLRMRAMDPKSGYEFFSLPFCSRCTQVVVDAVSDVVSGAKAAGHLAGRVEKEFRYFPNTDKDTDSAAFPCLVHIVAYDKQLAYVIDTQLKKLAELLKGAFSTLIISPYGKQCRKIAEGLRKKGYRRIHSPEGEKAPPTILDALALLADDPRSNLGWRIVLKQALPQSEFQEAVKNSHEQAMQFEDAVPKEKKKEVLQMAQVLTAIRKGKEIKDSLTLAALLNEAGYERQASEVEWLQGRIRAMDAGNPRGVLKNVPITTTTIRKSKGLAADVVFLTHLDAKFFLEDKVNVSDYDICKFLVAITRARKALFLISTDARNEPPFVRWIDDGRIQRVEIPRP
jgi:superfamily I DNA/RNA helicase